MTEPTILPVPKAKVIDDPATDTLEEVLEAGRVTAVAIIAKEDAFTRWTCLRAYTNADRYNLVGQLTSVIADLVTMVERD